MRCVWVDLVLGGFGWICCGTVGGVLGGDLRVSFVVWFGYFGEVGVVGVWGGLAVVARVAGVCWYFGNADGAKWWLGFGFRCLLGGLAVAFRLRLACALVFGVFWVLRVVGGG